MGTRGEESLQQSLAISHNAHLISSRASANQKYGLGENPANPAHNINLCANNVNTRMNPNVEGTPKKVVRKKGRKPKPESKDDYCRICNLNFKVQYGNSKFSTENLFKPSERKENKGQVLAEICKQLGFPILKTEDSSDRVCRICSRKIRNAIENVEFLGSRLERKEPFTKQVMREKLPVDDVPNIWEIHNHA